MPLQQVLSSDDRALQDIADAVAKSRRQLIITGAGISTACGIPDFRSKDGLYNLIPDRAFLPTPPTTPCTPFRRSRTDEDLPSSQSSTSSSSTCQSSPSSKMRGQDLFDMRVFQSAESTTMFYQFIASLRQRIGQVETSSSTHKFIRTLRDGGRLMRCYTQNIDGLEARDGLCTDIRRGRGNKRRFMKKQYDTPRPDVTVNTDFDGGCEVVQLHGELSQVRCRACADVTKWTDEITDIFLDGGAPACEQCSTKSAIRVATGKRGLAQGELRPNIVLYGEDHPQNVLLAPIIQADSTSQPDLLIIMGTSLKVHGLQKLVRDFAKAVHAQKSGRVIFVNRTKPSESVWDGVIDDFIGMDCDDWVQDLRRRREDLWLRQGELKLPITKTGARKRARCSEKESNATANPLSKRRKIEIRIPRKPKPSDREACVAIHNDGDLPFDAVSGRSGPMQASARVRKPLTEAANCYQTPRRQRTGWKSSIGTLSRPPASPITPPFSLASPCSRAAATSQDRSRVHVCSTSEGGAKLCDAGENEVENRKPIDKTGVVDGHSSPCKRLDFGELPDGMQVGRPARNWFLQKIGL